MFEEKKKVALTSVLAAFFLTSFKIVIGILTGSLGILSEALHSALDLVAAVITYFSVKISDKPADQKHNFGYGKIENLSALIQTGLLLITCVWIIYEAIARLVSDNVQIDVNIWSFVVIISSIVIDINRSRMLYKTAKKFNSQALEADALHFSTDIWSSAVVLLGLVCANFGFFVADSIAALAVALIVLGVSFKLGKKAVEVLLDKAPPKSIDKVRNAISNYPEIIHFHDLKIRTAGADTFIKVNIHLNPNLNLLEVHNICDQIESDLNGLIDRCETCIHVEPHSVDHNYQENIKLLTKNS